MPAFRFLNQNSSTGRAYMIAITYIFIDLSQLQQEVHPLYYTCNFEQNYNIFEYMKEQNIITATKIQGWRDLHTVLHTQKSDNFCIN